MAGSTSFKLAIGYVFFNVLLFILISSFGQAGYSVGSSTISSSVDFNTTTDADVPSSIGWLDGFFAQIWGLPWWINTLFVVFEVVIGGFIVFGLVRGM